MTEDKTTSIMRALKNAPARIAEKASTAEAVWHGAGFPTAETKTAAGTAASSNAGIFSESKDVGPACRIQVALSFNDSHYGKYRKNIFFSLQQSNIRRTYAGVLKFLPLWFCTITVSVLNSIRK
jgi:hypothetical protein